MRLQNRHILLGVSGGIAAYKSAELVRLLQKEGASVRVIMTCAATEFITPLTFQALSGHPVHLELLDADAEAGMGHIALARWADAILIAPATADMMARLAHGQGDDLLSTVCLASAAPLILAPAMNQQMWKSAATRSNQEKLLARGVHLFGPAEGEQACGDVGPGRMLEPAELCNQLSNLFEPGTLAGKSVLITAGPTREAIDPVRYLSNHSSGKMGYALAEAAAAAGARVCLISGPTSLPDPARVECHRVVSAQEMYDEVHKQAARSDIFIGAAAVADYRPVSIAGEKIKKSGQEGLTLQLVRNPDILADVAKHFPTMFTVGFAAETQQLDHYALDKMQRKRLGMIIANDVSGPAIGFNSEDNAVTAFWNNQRRTFPAMRKTLLATKLIELISQVHHANTHHINAG